MITHRSFWLLLSFSLFLAVPATAKPGPAKTIPSPRREIQAIYNKMNAAAMQKNVDGFFDYNDDDFTTIDQKGHIYEASSGRQETQEVLDLVDSIKAVSTIQSFTGTDTEATVTVKDHVILTLANAANGRRVKLIQDDVSRDYWTYTAEGWRRKRTRILSGKNAFQKTFNEGRRNK